MNQRRRPEGNQTGVEGETASLGALIKGGGGATSCPDPSENPQRQVHSP